MQDNLVIALEGHCPLNSQRAGHHLTISSCWDRAKVLWASMELSRLRSFTVFGAWRSFFISKDSNMRLLRVLDLEDTLNVNDDDLDQIGKLLTRLKFLSLRGCNDITHLPNSLSGLRQLQTLDIKGTSIVSLPAVITKLEKLQYVTGGSSSCMKTSSEDGNGTVAVVGNSGGIGEPPVAAAAETPPLAESEARTSTPWSSRPRGGSIFSWLTKLRRDGVLSSTDDGVRFHADAVGGIRKMTALHTLGGVNVEGASGEVVLRELKKLAQLCKLKLGGVSRKNWQVFCDTISGHEYLESLSVVLDDEKKDLIYCLDDISNPPKALKKIKFYGANVHMSLVWMKQLDKLRKVDIENHELTVSTQEDIDNLMELPCQDMYHCLCVKPIQDGELRYGRWESFWVGEQFKAAKTLKIDCGNHRSELVFGSWIPQFVQLLVVHCSSTEASVTLSGIDQYCLPNLKELWLTGTYSQAVKQHLQDEVDKHVKKPVLKLPQLS